MAGGYSGSASLRDVYMYDWTTEEWIELEGMLTAEGYHACAYHNGSIITAGVTNLLFHSNGKLIG